ncbi:MAG: amidohydrolase family protein [Burkholderiales bacterium]
MLLSRAAVFDGERRLPPDTCLLLEGDRIARIAPAAAFDGYAGPRLDLSGPTVLPGLIDCHAHLVLAAEADVWGPLMKASAAQLALRALDSAQRCLRGGVTSLRDCGGVDHIELAVRDATGQGTFLGPTVRAAGRFICMCGGTNHPVARIADGEHEVRVAVREQVHAGSDFVKLMATGAVLTPGTGLDDVQYTSEELRAGIAEAARLGRDAAVHAIGATGVINAVRAGARSVEHGVFLTDEAIDAMLGLGTWVVPTLGAVSRLLSHRDRLPGAVVEKAQRVAASHRDSIRRFHRAGGRIAMGGDTGTPFNPHGENAWELLEMVRAGLSPEAALVAATSSAADLMRLPTRGRLRAGHHADVLVVRGDPLEDILCAADPARHAIVVKGGRFVQRSEPWGTESGTRWAQTP